MALKDMFKKKYTSTVYCNNCNTHSEVQIPKGVTILQFVETGPCPNCNCSTLVADYRQIDEFRDQPKQQVKVLRVGRRQDTQPLERAQIPRPRPSNRPANLLPPKRPAPPEEPDFTPKGIFKNDVDFWTGNPKRRERREEQNRSDGYENY